ncbi:MAG: hypothetical protein LBV79_09895 [Candidatus Adiutrix sp.]|nr:hypothetical protein [Candidatus Adiutrix sp.]
MKKFLSLMVMAVLGSGCAVIEWPGWGAAPAGPSQQEAARQQQEAARQQFDAGQAAFDQKLSASRGLPLAQLRDAWGGLDNGPSLDGLSVFQWRQTARIIPPAREGETPGATLASCLAMFIVQGDVVVDATSEGQCFDYRQMPAWQPFVTQSTDGRVGEVAASRQQ